jgi:hypothetical protein
VRADGELHKTGERAAGLAQRVELRQAFVGVDVG